MLRLFLLSLVYFLLSKLVSSGPVKIWGAILLSALLFGAGHLPTLFALGPAPPQAIARVLLLNGAAGILFGWLYVRHGLLASMVAHASADLVVHGLLRLF